jgi:outer membrane protein TolC
LLQANNALLNLIGTDRVVTFVVDPADLDQLFLLAQERAAQYQKTDLIAIALAQRPDYQQSQLQRQQLALEQQLAADQQRWQVDAIVDGNLGDGSRTELGLVARRTLNDPQLETTLVSSQVKLQQQDNTLAQQQDQIRNDVTTRLGDVAANQRAVAAAERATQNARRQLQANQEQYRLGRGSVTLFQIIAQEEDLVTAQTNELESRMAFLNSVAQLEQTVGITLEVWADQFGRE